MCFLRNSEITAALRLGLPHVGVLVNAAGLVARAAVDAAALALLATGALCASLDSPPR